LTGAIPISVPLREENGFNPDIRVLGRTPEELTEHLLDKAQIAIVLGTTLGENRKDFIRISYANSCENLNVAMERMKKALKKIEP
jgi:aspartate aminotransferase